MPDAEFAARVLTETAAIGAGQIIEITFVAANVEESERHKGWSAPMRRSRRERAQPVWETHSTPPSGSPGRDGEMLPTSPPPGVITTRTLGPMLTVEPGNLVVARIHRVGQVQAAFGKDT
jgi:hypothetical protein